MPFCPPAHTSGRAKLLIFFDIKCHNKKFFLKKYCRIFEIMKKLLGFGLLAVGAWLFLRKGIVAQRTTWRFGGFSADWKKKIFNVTLIAGNPIGDSLTLKSLTGDLYFVGNPIASISNFTEQIIAPYAESPIKLVMRPNLAGIASTAMALIKSGSSALKGKLKFVGTANVQNIPVPIDTTF